MSKIASVKNRNPIRRYRKRFGMTQEELADIVGVNVSNVSRWENQFQRPNQNAVIKMAKHFQCSPLELLKPFMTSKELGKGEDEDEFFCQGRQDFDL